MSQPSSIVPVICVVLLAGLIDFVVFVWPVLFFSFSKTLATILGSAVEPAINQCMLQ
jgi:hypothetical protein